ncbi:hypothetical protein MSNKSG1_06338 [Marinobacter santoriniensis NKSG1]|jgi:cytochrome c biogenesis protein CcdA|uniref:DUF2970 domain-containing protein n=1 Tax=Marinobacter santoriniensis NKSG1 TaxID=1288826 RepID=M7DCT2_9GAMM|nr:DUF2970 domain-containing protein [Marinobacter santoriniensis]EMP55467.1 hypothetical protein MSNKSG1_06338 [Marinobacter santoriniensis NKSG1]
MSDPANRNSGEKAPNTRSPGVLKVLQSVLAGALGVQSSRRREEDFSSHSPWPYIIGGVIFTAGFVLVLVLIVQAVLAGH